MGWGVWGGVRVASRICSGNWGAKHGPWGVDGDQEGLDGNQEG